MTQLSKLKYQKGRAELSTDWFLGLQKAQKISSNEVEPLTNKVKVTKNTAFQLCESNISC